MDMGRGRRLFLLSSSDSTARRTQRTGTFTNCHANYVNYDQVGCSLAPAAGNLVRGGLIFNSDFANLSSYGVATPG